MKIRWTVIVVAFVVMFSFSSTVLAGYTEAPVLLERVEQGELPPVEERLPYEPFIVGPGILIDESELDWEVGTHGGTLLTSNHQPDYNPDIFLASIEPLVRGVGLDTQVVRPNIVESYQVNDDNTVFQFTLRKGLRWSDGEPVTTEDIRFTYEDVLLNETLTSSFPVNYRAGGSAAGSIMELEIVDDYTFKFIFDEPYGSFMQVLALKGWATYHTILKPSHYLKQFHIDYTPLEDMRELLDEEELDDEWWELFDLYDHTSPTGMMNAQYGVGFPVLSPWKRVESESGIIAMERNPYYFKVDEAGNQLPYIDRIESHEVSEIAMITMKVLAGEIDFLREATAIGTMDVYRQNEDRGDYQTIIYEQLLAPTVFKLNPANEEEPFHTIANNHDFRRALNYAIDRQEIINTIYFGFGELTEWLPTEFNPEKAEELLDGMGMDVVDGFRQTPCGESFTLYIDVADFAPDIIPTTELLAEYFEDVGIRTNVRSTSRSNMIQSALANELYSTVMWVHSPGWRAGQYDDYLPNHFYGRNWSVWYATDGDGGIEPPDYVKEVYDIHELIVKELAGSEEQIAAYDALQEWYRTYIPRHILVENTGAPIIVSNDLRNVPHSGFDSAVNLSLEQFFFYQD